MPPTGLHDGARLRHGTAALGAVGVGAIAWYLVTSLQRLGYPYELTYFEGSTIEVAARVESGEPLYGPPTTTFTPWPYPPLYFWITGAAAKVLGLELPTMRLVSFAASLAVLGLLAAIVYRAGGSRTAAVVAAGLYAATHRVSGAFADTARVDSLLLALLLGSVLLGMRVRTWKGGIGLGALLLLSFLAKQNAVIVAVPMLAFLILRRRSVGVAATVTLGGGLVASTLVGNLLTDGWYARYVIEQLPSQAWTLEWLWAFWWRDLLLPFAVGMVVVAALVVVVRRSGGGPSWSLLRGEGGYLVACAAGLVVASWAARLHEGGYANVAMPAQAALAGALGLALAGWLRSGRRTGRAGVVLAALLAAQVVLLTFWQLNIVPSPSDREAGDRFIAELRALPGTVLVPTHPYYLRMAGRPTHASSIAINDVLKSSGGASRLTGVLPWSLDGVSAVVLDNATDVNMFGPQLSRDFTLVTATLVPDGQFLPQTDLPTHPSMLYVRTSELSR